MESIIKHYQVAHVGFSLSYPDYCQKVMDTLLGAYQGFECDEQVASAARTSFTLTLSESGEKLRKPAGFREECRQDEEGQLIISGSLGETQKAFLMAMTDMKSILVTGLDYQHSSLLVPPGIFSQKSAFGAIKATVDTSLMLLYAMRSATGDTLLFHSSTVVKEGKAYLFLGKSGTGKSTHSGLWLKHIAGTRLLNDDNPVVYVTPEGTPMVSGSPWSGKTPCYKNEEYPVGGIVQ